VGVVRTGKRSSLRLPKEHGAWAMLYVPFAVGTLVAWTGSLRLLLLLLSVTFVFVARESLLVWWRARDRGREDPEARRFMIIYSLLAALFGAPLLFAYKLYWLAPIAAATLMLLVVNAQQAVRRKDRTISGEMMAIAGLTITAPAAYYVAIGVFGSAALLMWALCALYFTSSVFYVKLRVHTINPRKGDARKQSWWRCALYHSFLLAALLLLAITSNLNLFALAAFSPVLIRAFWHLANPVRQINLRRVGWLEIIYSVVFLIFMTLTFRS
jgi:YwiC-like protein